MTVGAKPAFERAVGRRNRAFAVLGVTALALACAAVLAIANGALPISLGASLSALGAGLRGQSAELGTIGGIVWDMRLPRVLMACLVGGSLGASGAAMQGLFRNPLADPYLLGVASGAAFGATVALSFGGLIAAAFTGVPITLGGASGLVPVCASLGAAGAVLATLALARTGASTRSASLLLAGIVVGSVLVSATTWLMLRDADRLRAVVSWTLGNLAVANWQNLGSALPYALIGFIVLFAAARGLDALQLGEDTARTLGVDLARLRIAVILGTSIATAAAVAYVGIIGFVGLVAPHVMRRLGVPGHRVLLPASALGGALLLVLADLGARTWIRPAELPVGVVTTLIGGPFFLWLLRKAP